jgi:DNA-binding MarR family transcriptional regulator
VSRDHDQASRFDEQFRAVYLAFHRRDGPRSEMPAASRAVLEHLALSGPLTIGEAARHLRRAQSVVSEIVSHLERDGLLERESDPADRRRTLVWLTDRGQETLRGEHNVLGIGLLTRALTSMPPGDADALIEGLAILVSHAPQGEHHEL